MMSHFAYVDENNVVTNVLVIEQDVIDTGAFGDPARWIQTSYNTMGGVHYGPDGLPDGGTPFRKNFAGIGFIYDPVRDAFMAKQPYPSWLLDEDTCQWVPPTPYPSDGNLYTWDEETLSWVQVNV